MTDRLICGFSVHEAAELFPLITGPDFDALVEDIRTNGQMEPVVLDGESRILDGRNRARACERLGIRPTTKRYDGDNPVQYVVSHNLHRRHLTDGQRAMIAAKLAQRPAYRLGEKQPHMELLPPTISEAAALLQVTENTVQRAKIVHRNGSQDLIAATASGEVPVATAARVAKEMPKPVQDAYVANVRGGADPVKAAPTAKPDRDSLKPTIYGKRRKHVDVIDAIVVQLAGAQLALKDVTALDASVTAEEAKRLARDLSEQIRSLNRINNLIKERTSGQ